MSIDFIFWALGLAVFGVGYAIGRHHGRKAESEAAARIAPMPGSTNRTQDGPPPKGRV